MHRIGSVRLSIRVADRKNPTVVAVVLHANNACPRAIILHREGMRIEACIVTKRLAVAPFRHRALVVVVAIAVDARALSEQAGLTKNACVSMHVSGVVLVGVLSTSAEPETAKDKEQQKNDSTNGSAYCRSNG